ncbi:MAG: periplasmic heavy metal sensor [Candidatus Scalindua sp.]|nr:periplasmic heavy metal sensor [Candidatus Scalindua sp.]
MNVKLRQVIYSLGIVVVMLLSTNVYSQPQGDSFNRSGEMREKMKAKMQEVFKQLDLSPEQQEQLQTHRKNHRGQGKEFRKDMKAKREAIRNELQKEELNMENVYKVHNELKDLLIQKADQRLEGILAVRKILTAEQFRTFCELRKEMHPRKGRKKDFF